MKVDEILKAKLKALKIEFVIKKTSEAVNEYNKIYKDKKVVVALHLTCCLRFQQFLFYLHRP